MKKTAIANIYATRRSPKKVDRAAIQRVRNALDETAQKATYDKAEAGLRAACKPAKRGKGWLTLR